MYIFSFTIVVQSDKCMQEFCVKQIFFYSILINQTVLDFTEPQFDSVPEAYESVLAAWSNLPSQKHCNVCFSPSTIKMTT